MELNGGSDKEFMFLFIESAEINFNGQIPIALCIHCIFLFIAFDHANVRIMSR